MTETDNTSVDWDEQDRLDARASAESGAGRQVDMVFLDIPGVADEAVAVMFNDSWEVPRLLVHKYETPADTASADATVYDLSGASVEAVAETYDKPNISDGTREDERLVITYNSAVDNVCIEGVAEGSVAIDYDDENNPRLLVHTTPSTQPTDAPYLPPAKN